MMEELKPEPPQHLKAATRAWWSVTAETYELEPHHLLLLTAAAECLDRATEAREAITNDGPYFLDRHGARKPHPGLQVERDNRALFSRLLRELALDVDGENRPPPIRR